MANHHFNVAAGKGWANLNTLYTAGKLNLQYS